jgi:hypothetical protein
MFDPILTFAAHCADLTSDQIYEVFEYGITPVLRDSILALASADSREPVREALNTIGDVCGVHALSVY